MAKLEDIIVTVRVRTTISFWDAVKLRLSGAGYEVKRWIELEIERREEENAAERDRPLS